MVARLLAEEQSSFGGKGPSSKAEQPPQLQWQFRFYLPKRR